MTTRKQISDAFREARQRIESELDDYICNAVPFCTEAGKAAGAIVQERMGYVEEGPDGDSVGPFTLSQWLRAHGHWTADENSIPDHLMRQYRLRWLDALIEEFSA